MENFTIEPSPLTPFVSFDSQTGILELKGRSSPDNAVVFYEQVISYFDQYFVTGEAGDITINVGLEYFNTSSLKCIFQILRRIKEGAEKASQTLEINWFYEEDDEEHVGNREDISSLLDMEFNYHSDGVGIS